MIGWAKFFAPDSPTAMLAELRQTLAGLQFDLASIKGERDEVSRQRDKLAIRVEKLADAMADIRRRCDLEMQ